MCKLSIITINYNNALGLQKTMQSVLSQTSTEFEYIIIDGDAPQPPEGGVVADQEVIDQFIAEKHLTENGFTTCTWLSPFGGVGGGFYSEPDSGIYNAMNKGIRMAKGEYIQFLNSGDWLVDKDVIDKILKCLSGEEIVYGNMIKKLSNGKVIWNKEIKEFSFCALYIGGFNHPATFQKRCLFERFGMYDETLKIVSDWKWYLNVMVLNGITPVYKDIDVTYFDMNGISTTNLHLDKAERRKVLEELIPAPILADYDKYHFDIIQMERIKRYPIIYRLVWFIERALFKFEKWKCKYFGWK